MDGKLSGTLKELTGNGLIGMLMRRSNLSKSSKFILQTVQKLCQNKPLAMITPSKQPQIPISVWNCFLGALLRHSSDGNANQLRGFRIFEELENSGKSNLGTAEAMLECLSDRRNWELLKDPREGILFAQQIFQVALKNPRYCSEKCATGRAKVWTKWLKINIKHARHELKSLEALGQVKTECNELFGDSDAVVQLIYPSLKYSRSIFLHRLVNSLSPSLAISPLDLHHLFCNEHLMAAHDASEVLIRWLKSQGTFCKTLPIWDEVSAIRLLEWCNKRAFFSLSDSKLVQELTLMSINELGSSGRIRRAHLDKFMKIANGLGDKLNEESKLLLARYSSRKLPTFDEFESDNGEYGQLALSNY